MKQIIVDYELLEQQIVGLTLDSLTDAERDGLLELLEAIAEQKPFAEGKDK